MMTTDLKDTMPGKVSEMQKKLKGLMQSYYERMDADSVKVRQPGLPE